MILQEYRKRKGIVEQEEVRDEGLSGYEKPVFHLGFCLLFFLRLIAAWSVMLHVGEIRGDGLLGLLMGRLPLHPLLKNCSP